MDGASVFNTRTARGRLLLVNPARGEEKLSGRASPSTTEEEVEWERGPAPLDGSSLDGFGRPHPLGNLPPKPGGAAALGVAPHLSWLRERGWEGRTAP